MFKECCSQGHPTDQTRAINSVGFTIQGVSSIMTDHLAKYKSYSYNVLNCKLFFPDLEAIFRRRSSFKNASITFLEASLFSICDSKYMAVNCYKNIGYCLGDRGNGE